MRRTIMRGLALVGIGTLGLTGPGAIASAATGDGHRSPDPGSQYGPASRTTPPGPSDTPTTASASASPSHPRSVTPTGSRSPGRTPTVIPSTAAPEPTRVRLHTALVGARMSGAHSSLARYAVRVRATGGVAHRVRATIAVRPRGARFATPTACHGRTPVRCRLGDVHRGRLLTFRQRPGHPAHRFTIAVTVTAANAPAKKGTMVLVLHTAPAHTVREAVPRYVPPETVTQRELTTVAGPTVRQPAAPLATIFSTPDAAEAPLDGPLAGGPGATAPSKPRLPVIAPRPGPRPTPNGAPVTVRPIANGHPITGNASGMPTRTILGLLAAAASFVGLVTALVLIRRRNET